MSRVRGLQSLRMGVRPPLRVPPRGAAAPPAVVAPVLSDVTLSAALGSVGDTLTATPVYSVTGTAPVVATYQWTRGGVDISGATSSSYTLVGLDEGAVVRCRVPNATGPGGSTGPVTSSGLCQVRVYGLGRAALGDDWISTVELVGVPAEFTVLCLTDVTAVGITRGSLTTYGRASTAPTRGFVLQTAGTTLEMVVSNAASNNRVAAYILPGAPATLGEQLYWGSSDGATIRVGYGDPAVNTPATSTTAGHQTVPTYVAGQFARPSDPSNFQLAARSHIAVVVPRIMSDAEITAIAASPDGVRAALIDAMVAEPALLWWLAPVEAMAASGAVSDVADVEDLAGMLTHVRQAGAARLTAEGP